MNNEQTIGVIVCAAGKGLRAGFSRNKLLMDLNGETVLNKTLSAFDFSIIDEIIITASEEDFAEISEIAKSFERTKVVLGGKTRSESVFNGLKELRSEIVLIHDGARPFVTREIIEGCIQSVKTYGSGICFTPCSDTVAVHDDEKILNIPDRATLCQIQTPQGFFKENILSAYTRAFELNDGTYTDDSSIYARFCGAPRLCVGSIENKKLTFAEDFKKSVARCGFGVDTHAFGKAQDFILLAGVKIPSASGLIAHSDGDVLCHAVMDAMLSGAGLRDIGHYFPDSDEKWKNANSMEMLKRVAGMLAEQGLGVNNISIAIQAEKPRLSKHIDDMKNSLSSVLGIDYNRIGISAGTNEGLGYIGEGKGITVNAYVLLTEK